MSDDSEPWRGEADETPLPAGIRALFNLLREPTADERRELETRYNTLMELGNERWLSVPPFTLEARCTKCGGDRVEVAYHMAPDPERGHPSLCLEHVGAHEHFIRQCRTCGFVWWERTLEPAAAAPAQRPRWWATIDGLLFATGLLRRREGARG